tara:strand:- start:3436 stop:3768 length:333 start_codon:yes stop_codon:yes gene_type:complete
MGTENNEGRPVSGVPGVSEHPIRLLIHPEQDTARYEAISKALRDAVRDYPETFTVSVGELNTVDHVGYHDDLRSSVVFAQEYGTQYKRLTIRPALHPVFAELLRIAIALP